MGRQSFLWLLLSHCDQIYSSMQVVQLLFTRRQLEHLNSETLILSTGLRNEIKCANDRVPAMSVSLVQSDCFVFIQSFCKHNKTLDSLIRVLHWRYFMLASPAEYVIIVMSLFKETTIIPEWKWSHFLCLYEIVLCVDFETWSPSALSVFWRPAHVSFSLFLVATGFYVALPA